MMTATSTTLPAADDLWRLAEECPADAIRWFGVGYQLGQIDGFGAGWDEGFAGAGHDMEVAWFALACKVRRDAARPTFAELQRRRGKPRAEVHQHALRQSAR